MRNLPKNISTPFIKITLERRIQGNLQTIPLAETPAQSHENPVYNKRVQFDVYDDNDKVIIQIIDSKVLGTSIGTQILMSEFKGYMQEDSIEVKELWFDFAVQSQPQPTNANADPFRPQVRINFNYMYSKYFMYDQ